MMLRQKTFFQAAGMALFPVSRLHREAGYWRRLSYYHANLIKQARGIPDDPEDVGPIVEGAVVYLSSQHPDQWRATGENVVAYHPARHQQYLVLLPGYRNVDGVWQQPLLKEVTGDFEPGHPCTASQHGYARRLGKKWAK